MNPLRCYPALWAAIILLLVAGKTYSEEATVDAQPIAIPEPKALEEEGAIIGKITYRLLDIFNTEIPEENRALYRLANKLHIQTRQSVIEDQLLFHSGELYSEEVVAETERILRANRYIQDARIYPTSYHDGVVDMEVTTSDVWTLHPGVSFGRKGGKNSTRFELEETNFLGTGGKLSLAQRDTVDRTEQFIHYTDNQVFRSWSRFNGKYGDNSDGYEKMVNLDHPFYSLDTRLAGGLTVLKNLFTQPLYDLGEITDEFQQDSHFAEIYMGWSTSGLHHNWAKRWTAGLTYDDSVFQALPTTIDPDIVPEDRQLFYPWIGYELLENDFRKILNHDQIGRTEDFFLGRRLLMKLGYAADSHRSDRDAYIFSITAENGITDSSGEHLLLLSGVASGRIENGEFVNTLISSRTSYYGKQSDSRLFYMTLQGDVARRLDAEHQLLIGGDSGLRGYPLRFQSGDKRALFTVEERFYSNWYPYRLFRVGGAIFFDAGRAWDKNSSDDSNHGMLKDIGFGLRLGNTRSGNGNVIHIDFAFPLDGDSSIDSFQFSVETKMAF